MLISKLSWLAGLLLLANAIPAFAGDDSTAARETSDIELLGSYDIVIGDLGDSYDGWDNSETRVYVETFDGYRFREHYFDSLPSALFVLRQEPGALRIVDLAVPEFAGYSHENHGHDGHGLIDGMSAWYLWDYDGHSRGGLPLVLAFYDYRDARDELRYRDGDILDLPELIRKLDRWEDRQRRRIYWRGWDRDRWDNGRWNNAWNHRWDHHHWDSHKGWIRIDIDLGKDKVKHDRWERSDRYRGRHDRGNRHDNDRGRYDRDSRSRDHDKDEKGRKRDSDRENDRDSSTKRTQEK